MPGRPAEEYGRRQDEDWEDEPAEPAEPTPEWLSRRFGQESYRLLADGRAANYVDRFLLDSRIARAALEFRDTVEIPEEPGMTGAERDMLRSVQASGKAAAEFVGETLRRHHDPFNSLQVDPTDRGGALYRDRDLEGWKHDTTLDLMRYCLRETRELHIAAYGFAVMTGDAIEHIREAVGDTPLVEIGAGNGWLAHEMNERGITVYPTDPADIDRNRFALGRRELMEVERLDGFQALEQHPDCGLLWSWPEMEDYVPEVMRKFTGRHLVYIGEWGVGCTGPREDLVVTMEGRYREAGRHVIPSFPEVNDNVYILERIDYDLAPAGMDAGEYPAPWDGHISARDLDAILEGELTPDLAGRVALAAMGEGRIQREPGEGLEANLRRNLEFSTLHIARATVSDAMRHGSPEARDRLEDRLLEEGRDEDEWAEARVAEMVAMAYAPGEAAITAELLERGGGEWGDGE